MMKKLLFFSLLVSAMVGLAACGSDNSKKESVEEESSEEVQKAPGEDYDLNKWEQDGTVFRKLDGDGPHAYYVRFNPKMLFFMEGSILNHKTGELYMYAVQTLAEHDLKSHTAKTGEIVWSKNTELAEEDVHKTFQDKTIQFIKEGDNLTVTGINDKFDGTYTLVTDDDF